MIELENKPERDFHLLELSETPFAYKQIIRDEQKNITDFLFLYANRAFEKLFGISKKDILTKSESDCLSEARTPSDLIFKQLLSDETGEKSVEDIFYFKKTETDGFVLRQKKIPMIGYSSPTLI